MRHGQTSDLEIAAGDLLESSHFPGSNSFSAVERDGEIMAGRERRSTAELARIVAEAVKRCCYLPRPGLWFNVLHVEARWRCPSRIRVWAVLHFSEAGSPFCCGEPSCHLGWLGGDSPRLIEVCDDVRRQLGLKQAVQIEFVDIDAVYHGPLRFKILEDSGE